MVRNALVRHGVLRACADSDRHALNDEHLVADVERATEAHVGSLRLILRGRRERSDEKRRAGEEAARAGEARVVAVADLAAEPLKGLLRQAHRRVAVRVRDDDRLRGGRRVERIEHERVVGDRRDDDVEARLADRERRNGVPRDRDPSARRRLVLDRDVDGSGRRCVRDARRAKTHDRNHASESAPPSKESDRDQRDSDQRGARCARPHRSDVAGRAVRRVAERSVARERDLGRRVRRVVAGVARVVRARRAREHETREQAEKA